MWVLEWGITGAILTYLPVYFTQHDLTVSQLGQLMAVSAVGLLVAPFVVGQVCDRWMASERYMMIAHTLGGFALLSIPSATEHYQQTGTGFGLLLLFIGLYAVAYFPTIPLASSLTFRHLPDRDKQFSGIRIWGTVGWVVAGLGLWFWLGHNEFDAFLDEMSEYLPVFRDPLSKDCFYLGAGLSFALAAFSFFLPHTPPQRSESSGVAPLETFQMFRNPTFSVLIGISFLLAMVVPIYSLAVPKLIEQMLRQNGLGSHWVPAVMTIGQISEFPALLLLPYCLKRFGMKATFALGMLAWVVRYGIFALDQPAWVILLGISFHGVCHVFLIIVIQLYVDAVCRPDLRASAQNLFAFVTMGIGMPAGFVLFGFWGDYCRIQDFESANFPLFFSVPAVLILAMLVAYWRYFDWPRTPNSECAGSVSPPQS